VLDKRLLGFARTRGTMPGLAPGAPSPGGPMHRDRERSLVGAGFSAGSASNSALFGLTQAHSPPIQPRVESHLVALGISQFTPL
jgi:hypothetical protein